jgi:type I restriction enzyme, S subunit
VVLQTFFDNFALLADAPNIVAKLRGLILQLAVEGKLVPQNSSDEPGWELLKRIQADKEALAKQKERSEEDREQPIEEKEAPFAVPDNWQWVRLSQITNIVHYGYTASANHTLSDVRLLRITDIQNGRVNWSSVPGCEIDERRLEGVRLANNDILIARTGGTIGKSYIVENLDLVAVFASYLIRAIPNRHVFARYLKDFLESGCYWSQLYEKSMGTGQPNVNATSLKSLVVPLPPFEEQKRIVAKVDELMQLCDELEVRLQQRRESRLRLNNATLAPLNNAASLAPEEFDQASVRLADNFATLYDSVDTVAKLRSTILQLAVQGKLVPQDPSDEPALALIQRIKKRKAGLIAGKLIKKVGKVLPINHEELPYSLPLNWSWVRLEEISDVGTGSTPLSTNAEYYIQGDIPWVTSAATSKEYIYDAETHITRKAVADYRLKLYPIGTLIIALYGQGKTRGQISQLKIGSTINQACAAISLVENSQEHSWYVRRFVEKAYEELRALAAGGAQPNLNVRKIKETLIPIPPLAEQKRIVAKVNQLMALCDELETKLCQTEADSEKLMNAAVQQVLASVSKGSDAILTGVSA